MSTREMLEFAIVLHKETTSLASEALGTAPSPFKVAELAQKVIRAAKSLHGRYEAACSFEWACTEAYEKATEKKEAAVVDLLKPYGIGVQFGRDPRGAPIALKLPSGLTNGWGEGYYVPFRTGK